uniref:CCHC-type domain-containing protein n=1 Tax=Trichuris muris TaxID=70415 RepID=A0A5S6QL11_TRIMR
MEMDTDSTCEEQQDANLHLKRRKRSGAKDDPKEERLRKQMRSEKRRLRRQQKVMESKVCYHCREKGHTVANCSKSAGDSTFGICFRCGSTEHTLNKCRLKIKGLPYARCFICGCQGHLAKACQENTKGIYPLGGHCQICNAIDHLARNCDKRRVEDNGEDGCATWAARKPQTGVNRKGKKVVKF